MPKKDKKQILVIAAHPDDEVLGCGATIAKHVQSGDQVTVLICGGGLDARNNGRKKNKSRLALAAQKAHRLLGTHKLVLHDFPDNRLDRLELLDVVQFIEAHVRRIKPHIVYTHHVSDVNIDHQILHQATVTATRPMPGSTVDELYFFEVPSSTEWRPAGTAAAFTPQYFTDVSQTFKLKLSALKAYASEMRAFPHPRSLKAVMALGQWRGACIGFHFAEAFMTGYIRKR